MWEVARNFSERYAYINISIWTIRFLILMAMATACTICWRGFKSKSKGESNDDEINDQPPLPVLPNDLIPEILVRLPARSLVRFRCICKQWNSIISDTQFAKLHLYKSSKDPTLNHHSLVRFNQKSNQLQFISCSVKSLFNNTFTPLEDLTLSLRPPDNYSYYLMLDTCNGVVCLFDFENMDLLLCNPITRLTSRKCPFPAGDTLDKIMLYHGFGYDHVSDKYKVVFVFSDPSPQDVHRTITKVYAFGDSCWTTIQNLNYYPTEGSGIFVSGTLNWVVVAPTMGARAGVLSHVIHSFNLEKETFGQVLLPEFGHDKPEHPVQASLKNCLAFCYDLKRTHLVVWLMKEYGVKESWTKLMAIPHIGLQDFGFYSGIQPLCMSENGQVLLKFISRHVRTVVYNPKDGRLEYPNMQPNMGLYTQHIYLESLVSPCF